MKSFYQNINMDPNNHSNIAGAITFPSNNEVPVPEQPRQPRNLQGLLRFAMEATKAEDAPGNSELGPMDEERRKFLEQALKSLTVDVAEILREAIKVLSDSDKLKSIQLGESLPEDVDVALSNILEYVDDIDIANDFYKMGGFSMFPICFGSENEEVRSRANQVLAELCQNNPFCQARTLECGLLNVLIHLVSSEQGSALAKCILAVSCACREFEPACRELIAQRGCEALAAALKSTHPAARTKAGFFVRYLCNHHPDAKEKFIELNIVRTIIEQVKSYRDQTTEHMLGILLNLIETLEPAVLRQCRDPGLNLQEILERHLKHPDLQGDTFLEEKEYCHEIMKILNDFPAVDEEQSEADR